MKFTQRLFDLVWGHKISGVWFSWIKHQKIVAVWLEQRFLWFKRQINDTHKVYFDLYTKKDYTHEFVWYATIEKNWINLWHKKRNKIKQIIQKHFASEYVVWNYRDKMDK